MSRSLELPKLFLVHVPSAVPVFRQVRRLQRIEAFQ